MTETYSNDSGDKLTAVTWTGGSKTYGFDGAGRTTSIVTGSGTTTLTYDYESMVTGITYPGSATNSFSYNGLDTRVGKTDSAGASTFRRMGAGVTAPVLGDDSASYTPGVSERRGSTSLFYGADYLGTNARLLDASQATNATRTYDAFGNLDTSSGSAANPFGFAGNWGYQKDSTSGLMLLGHRYYDASTGRFLTRDPIKDGRNWYGYCGNSPVGNSDPRGLSFWGGVGDFLEIVWQLPQELVGALGSIGGTPVRYHAESDVVVIEGSWLSNLGGYYITLGHYVLAPSGTVDDETLDHEYVHNGQSDVTGWFYIPAAIAGYVIGFGRALLWKGSLDSHDIHDASPLEMDADARSGRASRVVDNWAIQRFW